MFKKICLVLALLLTLTLAITLSVRAQDDPLAAERTLLNAAELAPEVTGVDALDTLVAATMDSVITDDMDTFDKVKACYDYLLDNMSYAASTAYLGTKVGDTTCNAIYTANGEVDGFGAVALAANKGLCNGYSAGFILMARRLGLSAKLVEGSTLGGGGGYAYHKWTEIVLDDVTYVFDPQLDQDVESWGLPAYTCFAKTYDQLGRRYRK